MKRLPGAALALALLLAGCWSRVEVNDRAIITAAGLDRLPDGQVRLAVHVVLPTRVGGVAGGGMGGGGGGGGGERRAVLTVYAAGRGPLEAARRLQLQVARRLFWAHMQVLILGEELARGGVREVLDFFARHREMRLATYVMVTPGEALHVMQGMPELERLPSEAIRETARMRLGVEVQLKEFLRALGTPGIDPVAPRLQLLAAERAGEGAFPEQGREYRLAGTAIFRDDRLVGWLDEAETRGLLWLQGRVKTGVVTLELPGLPGAVVGTTLVRSSVRKSAAMAGRLPVLTVLANTEDDIYEVQAPLDVGDPEVIRRLEAMVADALVDRARRTARRLQELGADAFGFGLQVSRDRPREWEWLEPRWREVFPHARVEVWAEAHIRRTGMAGKPRGTPEEQVQKRLPAGGGSGGGVEGGTQGGE